MKSKILMVSALLGMLLSSCTNGDNEIKKEKYTLLISFELDSGTAIDTYNSDGYWSYVYDPEVTDLTFGGLLQISHTATVTEYDGVKYKSWKGFCPTRNTDCADHSGSDWTQFQWSSITGTGASRSTDYMVACWDVQESLTTVPEKPTCSIKFATVANPSSIAVTNSAYGYYAMAKGTAFNKAFTREDYCNLIIIGTRAGKVTGRTTVALAADGYILNEWKEVSLAPLGEEIDMIYFQMESSETGQWGMNNPAYFCIDNLEAVFEL